MLLFAKEINPQKKFYFFLNHNLKLYPYIVVNSRQCKTSNDMTMDKQEKNIVLW